MKFAAPLALASMAMAAPSMVRKAPSALDVKLEMLDNSMVRAVITNNGKNPLKVLKTGTILDTAAVEKAKVFSGQDSISFEGLKLQISTKSLTNKDFQRIPAGKSIEVSFDVAEVHDLTTSGLYGINSSGVFAVAEGDSNVLSGSVPFESNTIQAAVDGALAAAVRHVFHTKRVTLQDCTGDYLAVTEAALSSCAAIASAGSGDASAGDGSKLEEFFKSSSSETRSYVAGVLDRAASECGSTSSGTAYYCSDPYGACNGNVLAYTLPSSSYTAYCPLYYTNLPALSNVCHSQDQANTNLHEMTHLLEVGGTDDYGGYGYDFIQSLSAEQNLNHADTYTLYAQAVYLGC